MPDTDLMFVGGSAPRYPSAFRRFDRAYHLQALEPCSAMKASAVSNLKQGMCAGLQSIIQVFHQEHLISRRFYSHTLTLRSLVHRHQSHSLGDKDIFPFFAAE